MQTIIDWIDPTKAFPPFNERILVLLDEPRSLGCTKKTWPEDVTVSDVIVMRHGPHFDDEEAAPYDAWLEEPDKQAAYFNYLFYVIGWSAYQYEDAGAKFVSDPAEWYDDAVYSDSIVAWAPMPDLSFALSTTDLAA